MNLALNGIQSSGEEIMIPDIAFFLRHSSVVQSHLHVLDRAARVAHWRGQSSVRVRLDAESRAICADTVK